MGCGKFLAGLACFLTTGCAAAIIVLTALKMNRIDVTLDPSSLSAKTAQVCYLGDTANGYNLCYGAYAISGVSLLATLALGILLCCTCNLCGLGFILEAAFAAAGTAAWALAGVVLMQNTDRNAALPQAQYRTIIYALTWAACALFAIMLLGNLWAMFSSCCRCCGGGGRRHHRSHNARSYDAEAPKQYMYGDNTGYHPRY